MKGNCIYFISTFLLLIAELLSAQNLKRFEPAYSNSENGYPTPEEIKKFNIQAIVIKSNQGIDTICYNTHTGLIDSKWTYRKLSTNDNNWILSNKVINYYTKSRLDSFVATEVHWRLIENRISIYEGSSFVMQYDSLNRVILWNHLIQYSYIDSGSTQFKVTKYLKWKKEDYLSYSSSEIARIFTDTSEYRYDNKNRLISMAPYSKATGDAIIKYKYQNDTILVINPEGYGWYDCKVQDYNMIYKDGRLIKAYTVEKPESAEIWPCKLIFETNYTYKNGLINKISGFYRAYTYENKFEHSVDIITK